jgi:hypothetical protein
MLCFNVIKRALWAVWLSIMDKSFFIFHFSIALGAPSFAQYNHLLDLEF